MFDDFCTEAGARMLAEMIRGYWSARGYRGIEVKVVNCEANSKQSIDGTCCIYGVRSNIGSQGYPPREIAA